MEGAGNPDTVQAIVMLAISLIWNCWEAVGMEITGTAVKGGRDKDGGIVTSLELTIYRD